MWRRATPVSGMSDLFSFFGVEIEEAKVEKKQEGKKGSKSKKETGSTKEVKKELYQTPIVIYTGFSKPYVIEEDMVDQEKVELAKIRSVVVNAFEEFTEGLLVLKPMKEEKNAFRATFQEGKSVLKGSVELTTASRMKLGHYVYDLASVMTDVTCSVEVSVLQKLVFDTTPAFGEDCKIYHSGDVLVPGIVPAAMKLEGFPVRLTVLGREVLKITAEDYQEQLTIDSGKEAEALDKVVPQSGVLERIIARMFPEFKGVTALKGVGVNEGSVFLKEEKDVTTPTKTLYPTDYTLSLIWTKIPLTPEDFGGKDEVEEKEIFAFLGKDYPEYSKERTTLSMDKKKKLIIPILKGSTKGAELITDPKQLVSILNKEYALCYFLKDDIKYRIEKKNEATYMAEVQTETVYGKGTFTSHLPKIPASIFMEMKLFFGEVTELWNTEAMVQLFWDVERESYFLYYPSQKVGGTFVHATRNHEMEATYVLVGDFHSHGRLNCSFSGTDNEDEKGTRLYGVFYDYQEGAFSLDLRMGCGGYFLSLRERAEEFIETDVLDQAVVEEIKKEVVVHLQSIEREKKEAVIDYVSVVKNASMGLYHQTDERGGVVLCSIEGLESLKEGFYCVPYGITEIATCSVRGVMTLVIPSTVTLIRSGAFLQAEAQRIVFAHKHNSLVIEDGAFLQHQVLVYHEPSLKPVFLGKGQPEFQQEDLITGRELEVEFMYYGQRCTSRCYLDGVDGESEPSCDIAVYYDVYDRDNQELDGGTFECSSYMNSIPVLEQHLHALMEYIWWHNPIKDCQITGVTLVEKDETTNESII